MRAEGGGCGGAECHVHIPNPTVSPQHCGKARGMFKSNSSVCLVSELGERHDIPARDLGGGGGGCCGGFWLVCVSPVRRFDPPCIECSHIA